MSPSVPWLVKVEVQVQNAASTHILRRWALYAYVTFVPALEGTLEPALEGIFPRFVHNIESNVLTTSAQSSHAVSEQLSTQQRCARIWLGLAVSTPYLVGRPCAKTNLHEILCSFDGVQSI